jgi:hypothetical protein
LTAAPRLALVCGLAGAALLGACALNGAKLPPAPVAAGPSIAVRAKAVPLNPQDPGQDRIGDFVYAGGVELTSVQTARLHGMSDLLVSADGALTAVGDEGDLLQGQIVLDPAGRLVGLKDARLTTLAGLDGQPLQGKENSDAEGMAVLPNGDRLISFERKDRIWLYPASGGPPRAAPSPDFAFPYNSGMEALAFDPSVGPDAYVTAAETSGASWTCRLSAPCVEAPAVPLPRDFSIVAMRRLPTGDMAYLFRAFDPLRGPRIILRIANSTGDTARLELRKPLTVDNFEGVDAVPGKDGSVRFYLVSDDNFSSFQRTLLLAFDWKKPNPKGARHEPH